MDNISINRVPLHTKIRQPITSNQVALPKQSFLHHLHEASVKTELIVSKHANQRLQERNIYISDADWAIVSDKVAEARSKGVNDSLVLMDQAALIVSAKNFTVITAMNRTEATNQLFTNIDGTIVLN
ncbi:TIGR02530 family flagellar biosynthesis protein [Psychrobacillus sp. FSL K6-4615]|uniref:TIGR02530 family flagellar biosynthesis protein n=1 Tax=Psychrobacillus sp. FSL K6-4615 TaxID=2921551 RepID=UPI0030F59189